jgi:hypothetical protein
LSLEMACTASRFVSFARIAVTSCLCLLRRSAPMMITCYLRYVIDASKLKEFEHYGKMWIPLVEKFGGKHHGYFLPSEGANNIALAMFTFPSFALYETYREHSFQDDGCKAAFKYARDTQCIVSYERSFFRPVFA